MTSEAFSTAISEAFSTTNLSHFKSTPAACEFALEMTLGELRDDLAIMIGSMAEEYSVEQVAEIEDQIADLTVALAAIRKGSVAV